MENATDALKIAFAVMVFILALTIAITMFSQLNGVSKVVLESSDITNYYSYETATNKTRIVGIETIIPTLYKYYKENFTVLFLDPNGNPLTLYKSQLEPNLEVYKFDVNEEITRHEPWTGSIDNYKRNLDAFLNGTKFDYPNRIRFSL